MTKAPPPKPDAQIDSLELLRASMTCWMAPILHDSAYDSVDGLGSAFDAEATSCYKAARTAQVRPARLYQLDPEATFAVRRSIAQNGRRGREVDEMLTVFDIGLDAVAEGRAAHQVLLKADKIGTEEVNQLRAHKSLVALDDFGRSTDTAIGVEARAIAALVATSDFLLVGRVAAEKRTYVAEPLFTMMFGSEFLSDSPEKPPSSWSEYVNAAAHAIEPPPRAAADAKHAEAGAVEEKAHSDEPPAKESETTPAPSEASSENPYDDLAPSAAAPAPDEKLAAAELPHTNEHDALRTVTSTIGAHLQSLAQQLPDGELHAAVERTIGRVTAFDVDAASSDAR